MKHNTKKYIEECAKEYLAVEEMITQCAHLAVAAVKSKLYSSRAVVNSVEANPGNIYTYVNCYKESDYGCRMDKDYQLRIDRLFRDIADNHLPMACYNQTHYDLILPVLMFHYIVTYESNSETATKRAGLNKDKQKNKSEDIKWGKTFPDKPASLVIARKERNEASFVKAIATADKNAHDNNFGSNDLIPDNVKTACEGIFSLSDQFEKIKLCAEYSRAGCFLYDLLSADKKNQTPLDTLLRLYMVSELHDILTNTRYILRGEAYMHQAADQHPLNQYVSERCDSFCPYPITRSENFKGPKHLSLTSKSKQKQFELLYNYLRENYIFQMPDILKFFLDKSMLSPYIHMDEQFKEYARAITALMKLMPKLTETQKSSDAVIRMVNLFREDKLQESWENSEDYATAKEAAELLDC